MGIFSKKTSKDYIKKAMDSMMNPHRSHLRNYQIVSDLLHKARQLDSENSEIYFLMGWVNNHHNYFDLAIIETNRAIDLNPNYADAYYNRGYAKLRTDDLDGALTDMDKAIELKQDFDEAIEGRKLVLEKMNS